VFANRSVAWFKVSAAAIAISYDFAWRFPLGSRSPYESPHQESTEGSIEESREGERKRETERERERERGRGGGSIYTSVDIEYSATTGNFDTY